MASFVNLNLLSKRRSFIIAAFFVLIIGALIVKKFGFPPYYQTNDAVQALEQVDSFKHHQSAIEKERFHFVSSGDSNSPAILFIHGSPGAWTAWADYLLDQDLRSKALMFAVDRAGFGGSDNEYHQPDLAEQSKIIMESIKEIVSKDQKLIIVGHSYGGPVALRIALDYPQFVDSLLLLAPSIDPELEDNRWYNKLAGMSVIRRLLPTTVDRSNQEILPLKAELQKMKPLLDQIDQNVTVIHGVEDSLVPVGNAYYAEKNMINSQIDTHIIEKRGHFIPWEEYDFVKELLIKYVD